MHLKRNKSSKTWPIPRKGTKYLAVPSHNLKNSLPLIILLREVLDLVKTRKETKNLINQKKIKVNRENVRDEKHAISLFDVISLEDKNLKLILKNKKFDVVEVKGKEAEEKIVKIIGKKVLKGGKIQVNLRDGRNFLSKEKMKIGDSVVVDLKNNKIAEILPFKIGSEVMLLTGKHIGGTGLVEDIGKKGLIRVKIHNEKINSRLENLMVVN